MTGTADAAEAWREQAAAAITALSAGTCRTGLSGAWRTVTGWRWVTAAPGSKTRRAHSGRARLAAAWVCGPGLSLPGHRRG
jgi:hypothetical protein